MTKIKFQSVVWKEDKYYVSQCLNADISSYGKTKKEALLNLQEALELYFEDSNYSKYTKVERPDLITLQLKHA